MTISKIDQTNIMKLIKPFERLIHDYISLDQTIIFKVTDKELRTNLRQDL